MSDFFELSRDPPATDDATVPTPPWQGPTGHVIGVPVALALEIARTHVAGVWLPLVTVYPSGLELSLEVRCRDEGLLQAQFHHSSVTRAGRPREGLPAELLRYGVEFADGRRATSLGMFAPFDVHVAEPEIVLLPRGGHGRTGALTQGLWLWPLPPPGPLTLVVEWPAAGIALTRVSIDAGSLSERAADAVELWPAPEGGVVSGAAGQFVLESGTATATAAIDDAER